MESAECEPALAEAAAEPRLLNSSEKWLRSPHSYLWKLDRMRAASGFTVHRLGLKNIIPPYHSEYPGYLRVPPPIQNGYAE